MLRKIVVETHNIFEKRDSISVAKQSMKSLKEIFDINSGIVGILSNEGIYYTFDFAEKFSMLEYKNLKEYSIVDNNQNNIEIVNSEVVYKIYNENELIGFCKMQFNSNNINTTYKDYIDLMYESIRIAFINIKNTSDLIKGQEDTILSFANVYEGNACDAGTHVKLVSQITKIMAAYLGYSEEKCNDIALAAMLHDIGNMSVPSEIIDKPQKLTDEEYCIVKSHVTAAECYLNDSNSPIIELAKKIALEHHERWDGNGYLGLKEDEINEVAAITAIADVFEVLISKRSYKEKWSINDAYNEIIAQSGKQFSPKAIEAFRNSFPAIKSVVDKYGDLEKNVIKC